MATRPVRLCRDFWKFRLPGRVLQSADAFARNPYGILFRQVCNAINLEIHGTGFWKGHLNWAADGSPFCNTPLYHPYLSVA